MVIEDESTMKSDIDISKKTAGELMAIVSFIGLILVTFVVFLYFLPPSIIQPTVAIAGGIILICKGWLKRKTGFITLSITAFFLFGIYLAMTQPVSVGKVAQNSPFPEIDAFLKEKKFSGSVLIAHGDEVLLSKGYDYADRNKMIPNTPETKYRIGSVTKQFTAMAIVIMQNQGKLDVQDKICKYISDCPAAWQDITIHHLLTHTSGIPDFSSTLLLGDMTEEEIITIFKNKTLEFKPGEKYSYSNTGYILLGGIIERASGKSYGEFLQENIFERLNMTNSGYSLSGDIGTAGYLNTFLKPLPFVTPRSYAAGWIHSTAEDLYRWDQALYTEHIIPQKLLDEMFAAHVPIPDSGGLSYGYGWEVGEWGHQNRRFARHSGKETGFIAFFERFPDDKIVIILLSNKQNIDKDLNSIIGYIHQKILDAK